jgi:adenosine deaminase
VRQRSPLGRVPRSRSDLRSRSDRASRNRPRFLFSNLLTKALPDEDAVRDTFRAFSAHEVPFTIATDGPEMMRTHLRDEFELLLRIGAVDESQLGEANRRGHQASFVRDGSA